MNLNNDKAFLFQNHLRALAVVCLPEPALGKWFFLPFLFDSDQIVYLLIKRRLPSTKRKCRFKTTVKVLDMIITITKFRQWNYIVWSISMCRKTKRLAQHINEMKWWKFSDGEIWFNSVSAEVIYFHTLPQKNKSKIEEIT